MKRLIKQKYRHESCVYKVTAFIGPDGAKVSSFKECTVVMVSPLNPRQGPSLPHSRDLFMPDTKIGDLFKEEISRYPVEFDRTPRQTVVHPDSWLIRR